MFDIFGGDFGWEMFSITRIPRTIALVLAGAAMSMSGLVMQLLTQNRFVEPTTTGTTEWAGLGLLLVLIVAPTAGLMPRMISAIVAAFVGTMIFFLFLRRVQLSSSLIVPIVGIMLGAVVGSITTYIALATDKLQSLGIWFAGSFTSIIKGQYEVLWIVAIVAVVVFIVADRLTVAGLGEDVATNVGLNYNRIILLGTGLIAIATGVVTVVVGALPFLADRPQHRLDVPRRRPAQQPSLGVSARDRHRDDLRPHRPDDHHAVRDPRVAHPGCRGLGGFHRPDSPEPPQCLTQPSSRSPPPRSRPSTQAPEHSRQPAKYVATGSSWGFSPFSRS